MAADEEWDVERLNLALAAARLGDWSWDARTDVITLSARASAIYGVDPGARLTRSEMRDLLHPDDRRLARLANERAIEEHADYDIEYRVLVGGRERWVKASGRPRYDDHGAIAGMFGVVQDSSGDHLLVRIDDAVRPLIAPADITYTVARLLGEHLGVNRCAYAFVEEDQDSFILTGDYNVGVESIVGRYRFRQFGEACLRAMRAGEPWVVTDSHVDVRLDEVDRQAYRLADVRAVICVPIMKGRRFVAAMAVHTIDPREWSGSDVQLLQRVASRCWESIERARVEGERSELLEAAQSANRAKDEFLAMLGHELRNPLAPITTALQLMRLRGDRESERERTIIERQVQHLTRLVDDLLDVSRIARGKVELKSEPLELSDVIQRAVEVASPLLEEHAHSLTLDVPPRGLVVDGDDARLVQVVSNLLTNAGKYTPTGGRIFVGAEASGEDAVITVRDSGIGMTPEVLPRVFDLFVQGSQPIDRALGGLGLGLSIVKSLVERHGGTVTATSEGPNQGSEFVVRLPLGTATPSAALRGASPRAAKVDAPIGGVRVLVVDDNEDAAEMMSSALVQLGCEVAVAHDGLSALALVDVRSFDLAMLDIGLPVMDGYELASRLRAHANIGGARLVAVTGYGQRSDRRMALEAGFSEHLVKPVDLGAVADIVRGIRGVPATAS